MATNNEIEFKQLLSETQYTQLKEAYFQQATPFTQTNYYIDTPDFVLKEHLFALRIREKDDSLEMTLKVPAEVGLLEYNFETTIRPEMNDVLDPSDVPQDIIDELKSIDADIERLTVLGSLTTQRMEVPLDENFLVLDRSEYLDMTDYELEFEVENHDKGRKEFERILNQFNIDYHEPDNKVKRFFDRKSELLN
ncbi:MULTISPECIES: CYTH domain-containing protein [Staphylococcus]|uniref:CYTH domain-containing protein n=1 Tax=Staphylococcus pettenkoferi TaxID=170573 RepID=A0A2N6QKZ3_9STAP|nr:MULTISPECIES: CYTH domain-containing protein [Staphylococcus]MCI2791215.1 CYTH domain-containing protein [Staphylococcus pettenkoferi]OFK75419.1 adenylate cyclase [Staphylococcus sp. HMSC071G07]PMC20346.1 CYTH domain-containing protein [Staphylococcus pettenkoferi]